MKKEQKVIFDEKVQEALNALSTLSPGSEEYKRQAEAAQCLLTMKTEKENQFSRNVTALLQTALVAGVNVLGLCLIIAFEKGGGFFTSKALSFLIKPKST